MARLRACLRRTQALSIRELEAGSGAERAAVVCGLRRLVACGDVEVLAPLVAEGRPAEPGMEGNRRQYYRLLRPADGDCLWQQEIAGRSGPPWAQGVYGSDWR